MSRRLATYLMIFAVAVILDLWTKEVVFDWLEVELSKSEPPRVIYQKEKTVIDGFFDFQATLNTGAFGGMFSGFRFLLLAASVGWVFGTLIYMLWARPQPWLLVIALALTAGGAFGNLWDRYFHHAVRDFIKWYVRIGGESYVWPNFNIADSCICVGVGLIILSEFRRKPEEETTSSTKLADASSPDGASAHDGTSPGESPDEGATKSVKPS